MRGPSSSHCAAAFGSVGSPGPDGWDISDVLIEFDPHGSLATTMKSGSDMGFWGLLGWTPPMNGWKILQGDSGSRDQGQDQDYPIHPAIPTPIK